MKPSSSMLSCRSAAWSSWPKVSRWYDLVRTGKATQTLGTKDYQCLMPLPSRELLYNPNLKPNNPGY